MYIIIARLRSLDEEFARRLVAGLNEIRQELSQAEAPGLIQSFLLREARGGAAVMSLWRSRQDLESFMQSEAGQRVGGFQAKLLEGQDVELEEYRTSWQAVQDESSLMQLMGNADG